jgi:hypothetical protein
MKQENAGQQCTRRSICFSSDIVLLPLLVYFNLYSFPVKILFNRCDSL